MKILHITNAYPLKDNPGYGVFIKEQIEALDKLGLKNVVLFINGRQKGKLEYIRAIRRIKDVASVFDLIHAHHLYCGFLVALVVRKVPLVVSLLSAKGKNFSSTLLGGSLVRALTVKRADALIFKGRGKESAKKSFYLPNGVNLHFFRDIDQEESREKLRLAKNKRYILFVSAGNLYRKEKRYDIFQQVLEELKKKDARFEALTLVNAPRVMVPYYYNAATVHLLPSDYEGSPNSVKEALACNLPVVSTDAGNAREMLAEVEGCFVSESNKPKILANLILKAAQYQSIKGREAIRKQGLDSQTVAVRLKEIYQKVLERYLKS